MNKVMVVKSSGAGSVVGYNYMDNVFIGNQPEWVEVGINGSHMVGGHHVLFEGNQSNNYDSDDTHGNAFAMTIFRNHLVGHQPKLPGQVNARAAGLMFGSWWHTFIGNVLGEPGMSPATAIWSLGYAPAHWEQAPDPKVLATVLRDGNFNYPIERRAVGPHTAANPELALSHRQAGVLRDPAMAVGGCDRPGELATTPGTSAVSRRGRLRRPSRLFRLSRLSRPFQCRNRR